MVGTKDGRVVATHGDAEAEVNRGLNCVKGYFLSKIMYGEDRLTQPLLRMKDGEYAKDGEFTPVSWDQAFDVMAEKFKAALEDQGARGGRHVRLRPVDDLGGLCRLQADEGRLPLQQHRPQRAALHGLGRRRLHAHLRHRRADGLLRRLRGSRRLRALGLQHGRDAPNPLDPHRRPPLQCAARSSRGALDLRAPLLRPRRRADHLRTADRPGDPQFHRQAHHRYRPGQRELRRQARQLQARQHRHRLRPAPRAPAAAKGG